MPRPILRSYRLTEGGIDFTVVRKRVKNTTIRIKNGEVVVTAPLYDSDAKTRSVVAKHAEWIRKHLSASEKTKGKVLLFGKLYDRVDETAPRASVSFVNGICIVRGKDGEKREKALLGFYKKAITPLLEPLFDKWQKTTGLYASKVAVTSARSYLGRCEVNTRIIKISCRIAEKDISVIDYVVLHELCHIRHAGHQRDFYALVAKYMPDYKARIKLMKK